MSMVLSIQVVAKRPRDPRSGVWRRSPLFLEAAFVRQMEAFATDVPLLAKTGSRGANSH